ncbi:ArsC/Spx/MgsR family protein [Enterococcus sp. JM9B]|uniref:ArsC/Spx/MgsR family protein n=1 Tax=Enterococcus sp. JM9B TaxID=1857216 RepID=UPI001374FB54|nr:ArsC/Spx/MgsR family protein [Enterococcus sp. JM9B]KAF1302806.1 hypothetical protein BAU16_05930 [Enterococcus sp. JM9B]
MIKVFGSTACLTCKKVKHWLTEHELDFEEVEVNGSTLALEDAKLLVNRCSGNTAKLIAEWCEEFQRLEIEIDDLHNEVAVEILCQHPTILRRPITVFDDFIMIGLDEDLFESVLAEKVEE